MPKTYSFSSFWVSCTFPMLVCEMCMGAEAMERERENTTMESREM